MPWCFSGWTGFGEGADTERRIKAFLFFVQAGTSSRKAAYLLSFLTSFSLRISIFGHMDDPAGGPVGRIFPELAFFSAGFPE